MSFDSHTESVQIRKIESLSLSSKALGALVKTFCENGKQIQFRTRGDSMFPFIKEGDYVLVSPYTGQISVQLGDIVAFIDTNTEKITLHRIIRLLGNAFIAKGDNCFHADTQQPLDNILGRVTRINNREHVFCGINFITAKKHITLFSKLGLTALFGKALKIKSYFDQIIKGMILGVM